MKNIRVLPILLLTVFLIACSEDDNSSQPALYDASGTWLFAITQTKVVSGDFVECGNYPVSSRSYTISQSGNDVSLLDKNAEFVKGSVSAASYGFSFREMENNFDEDYIDFNLNFDLSSQTAFTGTYRADERTFFTDYNQTFFCITEGTVVGTKISG